MTEAGKDIFQQSASGNPCRSLKTNGISGEKSNSLDDRRGAGGAPGSVGHAGGQVSGGGCAASLRRNRGAGGRKRPAAEARSGTSATGFRKTGADRRSRRLHHLHFHAAGPCPKIRAEPAPGGG